MILHLISTIFTKAFGITTEKIFKDRSKTEDRRGPVREHTSNDG
jgi:hypothetical protein